MAEQDVAKVAIITLFGLFKIQRMPFGLRNAGQSFQHFMDEVLEGWNMCSSTWTTSS